MGDRERDREKRFRCVGYILSSNCSAVARERERGTVFKKAI